jgi:hypothetical protein
MKKQFLHEHHNRQDKVKKPDCREAMVEHGRSPNPSPTMGSISRKLEAKRDYLARIRKFHFIHDHHVFRFGWSIEDFSRFNSLVDTAEAHAAFEAMKARAERDMERIQQAVKRGNVTFKRLWGILSVPVVEWDSHNLECDEIVKAKPSWAGRSNSQAEQRSPRNV